MCSARSGSTKALGTTNLLLRAADEALQRIPGTLTNGHLPISGINTPQTPSPFGTLNALYGRNYSFMSRQSSVNGSHIDSDSPHQNGKRNRKNSQPTSPLADSGYGLDNSSHHTPSGSSSSFPLTSQLPSFTSASKEAQSAQLVPPFMSTIDLIQSEHITAAKSVIRDPELLRELEEEIEVDCDRLRSFLLAAQVNLLRSWSTEY